MPEERKMPPGKQQFGIIVPVEIHKKAQRLASDMSCRISDAYARGIQNLYNLSETDQHPEVVEMAREITNGVDKKDWKMYQRLANFLRSNPDRQSRAMMDLILENYPSDKESLDRRA